MSTSLRSRTRRKSFTVSGFLPRRLSQISRPLAILASSTSQITAQSTSGLRKKHSRSPWPMPPQPMRPSRTLSLAPGSAARAERKKGAVRLLAASGARLAVKADLPRNLRREICVIVQAFNGIVQHRFTVKTWQACHDDGLPSSRNDSARLREAQFENAGKWRDHEKGTDREAAPARRGPQRPKGRQ